MKNRIYLLLTAVLFIISAFSSCASTQKDVTVTTNKNEDMSLTYDLESQIAELDAEILQEEKKEENLKKCSDLISQINKKLSENNLDKILEARLNAFLGRLSEIQGNVGKAKQYLDESAKKNKDEIQALILKRRLGLEKDIIKKLDDFEAKGLIYLESAIEAFQNKEFDISSGEFDIAFLSLPQFYRKAYNTLRDKAWNLKDNFTDNIKLNTLLTRNEITLMQMVEITELSSDILDTFTGGKKISGENLFNALNTSGLFMTANQPLQNTKKQNIKSEEIATRKLAARFLWNIYCTGKNFSKTKYSEKYLSQAYSPIKDVTLDNPDFDAVLGTVENEILNLPNGLSFNPDKKITAKEFYAALKKIN